MRLQRFTNIQYAVFFLKIIAFFMGLLMMILTLMAPWHISVPMFLGWAKSLFG